jgi:hypothetical protein
VQQEPKLVERLPGEEPTAPTGSPSVFRHALRGLAAGLLLYLVVFVVVGGLAGLVAWANPGVAAWNWPFVEVVFAAGAVLFAAGGVAQALLRDWIP